MIVFNNIHSGSRFGNRLLQNVGLSLLAKKFNYTVLNFQDKGTDKDFLQLNECCEFGLIPFSGTQIKNNLVYYSDDNILDLLNGPNKINHGILYTEFFQNLDFLISYKNEIKNMFQLPPITENNNLFIHVRLGDATKFNPGIDYYRNCIQSITFDKGYITTDEPSHDFITKLVQEFNLQLINDTPIKTIHLGRICNNIILSNGTFSWWIAFLSNAKNIFYPDNTNSSFHPNIYLPEWTKV